MISATAVHESFRNSLDPEAQLQLSQLQESYLNSQQQQQNQHHSSFYNPSVGHQNVQTPTNSYLQQHQNVDYAKVFDNDDLNQLFYESFKHDSLEPTPMGLSKSNSLDGLALLCNSTYGAYQQQQSGLAMPLYEQASSSPYVVANNNNSSQQPLTSSTSNAAPTTTNNSNNPFVNVMLIVDPATQKVICPRQTLQYQVGLKTEHHVVGPAVLDNVNSAQGFDIQQLLQQGVFHNGGGGPSSLQCGASTPTTHSITPPPPQVVVSNDAMSTKSPLTLEPTELPPLRALSAYNFFFRDERDRILNGNAQDLGDAKAAALLNEHWGRDRTKKRRHRKTHGKIDFTTLSKLISTRWKELPDHDKEFYRHVAAKDWERYQRELGEHKSKAHQAHLERHQSVVDNHLAVIA